MCGADKCCAECKQKKAVLDASKGFAEIVTSVLSARQKGVFTDETEMAPWIEERDQTPLKLALSLYTEPIESTDDGYVLFATSPRSSAWYNCDTHQVVIGLRGTSIGNEGFLQDIQDDSRIAFSYTGGLTKIDNSPCNLTLVKQAMELAQEMSENEDVSEIIFAGHSLGGSAALCLASSIENSRAVAFNPGAPPSKPLLTGPGPERATAYHIVGDVVSSHIGPEAARVVRILKRDTGFQDILYAHSSARAMANDGGYSYVDPAYEQRMWQEFGNNLNEHIAAADAFRPWVAPLLLYLELLGHVHGFEPTEEPVPGSGVKKNHWIFDHFSLDKLVKTGKGLKSLNNV